MKKVFLQQAYEAPEVETIEVKMGRPIVDGSCIAFDCGGVDSEDLGECSGGDEEL